MNLTATGGEMVVLLGDTPVLLRKKSWTRGDVGACASSPHAAISRPTTHQPMVDELIHGGSGREDTG
jgi:hypothetical protein